MDLTWKERFGAAFAWERVICRLIAAWCAFASTVLLSGVGFAELSYAQSTPLWQVALWTLVFFAVFSAPALLLAKLHTDSWFLLLTSSLCIFRWLLEFEGGNDEFLFVLAVIAVYALFVVYTLRVNEEAIHHLQFGSRSVAALAFFIGLASCAIIATVTCLRYKTFSSPNFDFGLFCNMFHNMKETGLPMVTSERDRLLSHFAVHVSPIYYLLLPFYYLFPTPMTLQIGQAVALALGVIPVVLLAKHHKLSERSTLLVTALYAFFPALTCGTFYDIHENCFLPLFLLLTFWFYEKKKYIPMYLSAVGVLAVKEDAAIYLLMFALFVLLSERNWIHGGALTAMSVGYFLLCGYYLEKHGLGMMVNRFDNLIYNKDDGLLGAIKTALVNPGYLLTQLFTTSKNGWEKLVYALQMLLPLGLLPFCSKKPSRWLLVAPLLINLLTYYQYQYDIGFQYHFGITAFLIYATIKNLPELSAPTRRNLLGIAAAACCCIYVFTVVPKLDNYMDRWESGKTTYTQMDEFLDTAIPADASVSASTFLLSHIADRDVIYETKYHGDKPDVDYVVLDMRYKSYLDTMQAYLDQGYTVSDQLDEKIVVLKKN